MNLKIGTDPELFGMVGGKYISSHDIIPGTKQDPYFVVGGAIQKDGVAFEFNTFPVETADGLVAHINMVREQMLEIAKDKAPDIELVAHPTATFSREYFDALPEEVKLLGCTPDYNAWTGGQNEPPSTTEPFRTGGGHIHIGFGEYLDPDNPEHFDLCCRIVKQLDVTLYPLSMQWDSDTKRRELYGKMGAFRPKTYGVEYRPLSNAWLVSDETIRLVFDTTVDAVTRLFNGECLWIEDEGRERNVA